MTDNTQVPTEVNTHWYTPLVTFFILVGQGIARAVRYAVSFRWVIDITRWLLGTGGTISESAFLLATTYVIINLVAHKLVMWLVFGDTNTIDTLNQIAMIAFSVLPELIMISAIAKSYEQWKLLAHTKKIECLVWAILFTLPTLVFAYMTIRTISGFVSLESAGQNYTLTGDDLRWRVISGWLYGVSQMLYAQIGKGTLDKVFTDLRAALVTKESDIAQLTASVNNLTAQLHTQEQELLQLKIKNATRKVKSDVTTEESNITQLPQSPEKRAQDKQIAKLKLVVRTTILAGKKPNWRQISNETGVNYAKVRRVGPGLVSEVSQELQTAQEQAVNE